ncbi:unnamed protein product, partial [Ectocarpus sp. 12 AP-2014]
MQPQMQPQMQQPTYDNLPLNQIPAKPSVDPFDPNGGAMSAALVPFGTGNDDSGGYNAGGGGANDGGYGGGTQMG